MKFSYAALALALVSAAYADTVKLSGECKTSFEAFEECGNTQATKVDDFVKIYQSEKCQNLYKDPIAALEKCNELDAETKDKLVADVKFSQAYNVLYTAKTEDGKACPLYRNNNIEKVKDTCASKACTDASIEAYKLFAEGKKLNKNKEASIEQYNNILKALQECGSSSTTVAANSTEADAANAGANNSTQVAVNGTQEASPNNTAAVETSAAYATTAKFAALVAGAVYLLF